MQKKLVLQNELIHETIHIYIIWHKCTFQPQDHHRLV